MKEKVRLQSVDFSPLQTISRLPLCFCTENFFGWKGYSMKDLDTEVCIPVVDIIPLHSCCAFNDVILIWNFHKQILISQ